MRAQYRNGTQVLLRMDELVNFLVEKLLSITGLKEDDITVEKDEEKGVFDIKINKVVPVHYDVFGRLEGFIAGLGFQPIDSSIRTVTVSDNSEPKRFDNIYEYINNERVRVILFLEEEINPVHDDETRREERLVYLKRVMIGSTSVVNSPRTKLIDLVIKRLNEFRIEYTYRVVPPYQFIEIRGQIKHLINNEGFKFRHDECVTIDVWKWKGNSPRYIEMTYWCGDEPETVDIPIWKKAGRVDVEFRDGMLVLMFSPI